MERAGAEPERARRGRAGARARWGGRGEARHRPDVAVLDEHAGVVDRLGEAHLEDLGLEAALQEVLDLEAEHEVKLHLVLVEDTEAHKAPEQCIALEKTLGVLLVEGEEHTGGLADLGKGVPDAVDLALAAEAVLADELELLVEALLFVRPTRGGVGLGADLRLSVNTRTADHDDC
jgi:hypothetical protein